MADHNFKVGDRVRVDFPASSMYHNTHGVIKTVPTDRNVSDLVVVEFGFGLTTPTPCHYSVLRLLEPERGPW